MALCYHFSLDLTTACVVARLAKEGALGPIASRKRRRQEPIKIWAKSYKKVWTRARFFGIL